MALSAGALHGVPVPTALGHGTMEVSPSSCCCRHCVQGTDVLLVPGCICRETDENSVLEEKGSTGPCWCLWGLRGGGKWLGLSWGPGRGPSPLPPLRRTLGKGRHFASLTRNWVCTWSLPVAWFARRPSVLRDVLGRTWVLMRGWSSRDPESGTCGEGRRSTSLVSPHGAPWAMLRARQSSFQPETMCTSVNPPDLSMELGGHRSHHSTDSRSRLREQTSVYAHALDRRVPAPGAVPWVPLRRAALEPQEQGPGALTRLGWSLAGRSREAPHGVLGRQLSVLPSGSRVCVGPSPSCVVQVSGLGLPLELCVSSLFRDCSRQVGQMLALLAAVRTISSLQAQRLEARSLAQGDLVAALARLGRGRCPRPADQWRLSHAILPGHCRPPAPSLPRTRYQGCHGRSP